MRPDTPADKIFSQEKRKSSLSSSNHLGEPFLAVNCNCGLGDRALVLLLEREESLLGDIVEQFNSLAHAARKQTIEMAELIEKDEEPL